MRFVVCLIGLALILAILIDAFESVLLPRRVTHGYRLVRLFYRITWPIWQAMARCIGAPRRRETFLSLFGPLSFLMIYGTWALGLIFGFAMLHWSLATPMAVGSAATPRSYLYFSGVTFFTLGYGDLFPVGTVGRFLAVLEAGLGFGFLAIVISYHPVLGQAFSERELTIALLDARGGSPPTAEQILTRCRQSKRTDVLNDFLREWETWSAKLLETFLSYPVLAFYRSQHDNQSWIAALTAILDTSALAICGLGDVDPYQARVTFAIARHAAVDIALVFKTPPVPPQPPRLEPEAFQQLIERLKAAGVKVGDAEQIACRLAELRGMYEPFVNGLALYLVHHVPGFFPAQLKADNWQTSAWMPRTPGIRDLPGLAPGDHFN